MGAWNGNYTRAGDPAAMFNEELRYLVPLQQAAKAAVDADFNDGAFSMVHQLRRIIETAIGDGSPNDGFEIVQSGVSTTNNFTIKGGDGTDDGAGRLFASGFPAVLKSDVEYSGAYDARMLRVMPQITGLTATILTDSTANWTVNEHAGKTLTPDVATPGTTFTILSNTATTITITAGDMTVGAAILDHYRIELSTPSGGNRTDEVYLDLFLDEVDENEDTNFVHTDLSPNQAAANRLVLRQFVRVVEGSTTPAGHVDTDGRQHYTIKIATLARLDADATVTTAMITDNRPVVFTGTSPLIVEENDLAPSVVATTLRVPNGSLTDLGSNVAQLAFAAAGAGVGPTSRRIEATYDISGETPPNLATVGTGIDVAQYPTAVDTAQKFKIHVPDDWDGTSDLEIFMNSHMSTAEAVNNTIRLETRVQVVDVSSGSISDTGNVGQDFTTLVNTNYERRLVLTISAGTLGAGDTIVVFFRRLGTHVNDVHGGALETVELSYRFTASFP